MEEDDDDDDDDELAPALCMSHPSILSTAPTGQNPENLIYIWHISANILHPNDPYSVTLKMVTTHSSETSKLTHYTVH